ncbi:hypothetical protein ACJMK2_008787 [Sinanodonta woodiana]|uniref:Uncharacterized protein n=1 Tax=Sinanodonta woodiana TaxID=1069815 RepID=A0ABD3VNY6_SINWO
MFIKSIVSSPMHSSGFYEHTDADTNKVLYCREVLVKQGEEAVPCRENKTEDSVRKCQDGHYQPDETNSSSSPQCFPEPECTEEGIKNKTCSHGYCWPVCICNLEVGKCGHYPLNCHDVRDIKCMGKILHDCSCALPDIPTQLPARKNKANILFAFADSTQITNKTAVTKDGSDTGVKGNEAGYLIPVVIIICSVVLVILVVLGIRCVHKRRSNRPIEANTEGIEMLESITGDKVSEATDSGVCDLSKGSDENLQPGETSMEGGRNTNNSFGDDCDAARGQSSSQLEVHNDLKSRVEHTLAEEEDSYTESDSLLSPDNPCRRDTSTHQSEQSCEAGRTNTDNLVTNDPDMTLCKWTSDSGTDLHHTDVGHRTDPDSTPILCQLAMQKGPGQRGNPIIADVEDNSLGNSSSSCQPRHPILNLGTLVRESTDEPEIWHHIFITTGHGNCLLGVASCKMPIPPPLSPWRGQFRLKAAVYWVLPAVKCQCPHPYHHGEDSLD